MYAYFLAANLFAITALLLGLYDFSRGRRSWRLLPLFLLVISRSLSLILLINFTNNQLPTTVQSVLAALEVFSIFCLLWALIHSIKIMPPLWQRLVWLWGGMAIFLSLMSLFPDWPVPYQLHSLIIAVFSAPLILVGLGQISVIHLAAPMTVALANFISLLGFSSAAELVVLLAYAFVVGALHREALQLIRDRQQAAELKAQDAIDLNQQRQRLLEVSSIISAVPSLDQSLDHVARSVALVTHSDQAVILMLDVEAPDQVRLAAIFGPEHSAELRADETPPAALASCASLRRAIDGQQTTLLHPQQSGNDLDCLYALWQENQYGPSLIQPLIVRGERVGALILGNPVTQRGIREEDQALCRHLASQIAIIVEAYRQWSDLERRQVTTASNVQAALAEVDRNPEAALAAETQGATVEEVQQPAQATRNKQQQPTPKAANGLPARSPESLLPNAAMPSVLSEYDVENYLSVIEAVREGVVVSDVHGQVRLVNSAAEQILGRSRRELLDQPIGMIYGEIDSGESIEQLATAFSRRNEPLPTFVESDDRAIQGHLMPWRNIDHEWLGIIAVFQDVTRQVRADTARNDFISALSRVSRGPLAIIKTNGTMEDYSPEQLKVQHIIHSNAERVVRVLDNAIQVTVLNKDKNVPRLQEVDVDEAVKTVVREITPLTEVRELEFTREIATGLPTIIADGKHLNRILMNLLSNACRFTPRGGRVTLKAWMQEQRNGNVSRPYLQMAVSDNGVGISSFEQKRIFDSFYRLDRPGLEPEDEEGMGMGLAVVKELVELHNGRIWVESTPGVGSVFQVSIPAGQG
jgi:PAS domain S-box-containing protein